MSCTTGAVAPTKLSLYLAATGAAVGAAAADGSIVYTQLGPVSGLLAQDGDTIGIDFNGDGLREMEVFYSVPVANNLNIKIEAFPETGLNNVTDEILVNPTRPAGIANNPLALSVGELISMDETATRAWQFIGRTATGTSSSGVTGSNGGGNFRVGDPEQFIGVRTIIDGATHYGWIGIVITDEFNDPTGAQDRLSGYVTGYAYESEAGVGIVAGAVPAPGALALLALGAAGAGRRRRVG